MARIRNITTMVELSACMMKLFNWFNERFFGNALSKVVITFESGYKKGAYGWIYTEPTWVQGDKDRYNINVSSDCLDRPLERIAGTLLHEMVHLYNIENNIKDTSRAGIYHNKRFKQSAEEHGLEVFEEDKIGYGRTQIRPDLVPEVLAAWEVKAIKIMQKRPEEVESKPAKESSTIKLVCPCCGQRCRVTSKEYSIMCGACTLNSLDTGGEPVMMIPE